MNIGNISYKIFLPLLLCWGISFEAWSQPFYFGADQSYVNEMEDCGAVFTVNGEARDIHQIFQENGCNLVRLRLWHTPSWYDQLNDGKRYSDLTDVIKSIRRVKENGMSVLLDFHLSDNWADPGKQVVPAAWLPVVDELDILKDSLYNYVHATLTTLKDQDLLPEMVQIGNETNRGILLSPEQNQTWTLEWDRNAALFNAAIQAVRDVSPDVQVALHLAGPEETEWWVQEFIKNGVTDFDVIAMSYYWAWHKPTTIKETGEVITRLNGAYPDKQVIIAETGYLWTTASQDEANNIISEIHPDYSPASPESQKQWLIDLTKEVIATGGKGVIYWEPSWVSTPCRTQWGKGSHQEHATFFDFDHELLIPGGIEWMSQDYGLATSRSSQISDAISITFHGEYLLIRLRKNVSPHLFTYSVTDTLGKQLLSGKLNDFQTPILAQKGKTKGIFVLTIRKEEEVIVSHKFLGKF